MIVTYQSKTGFTKKYAEWIGEALGCEVKDVHDVTPELIKTQDIVIHGGWLLGGNINGLDNVRKMGTKKLVVFAVGFTPKGTKDQEFANQNHITTEPYFYFEGGLNPEKMGGMGKTIIRMIIKKKVEFEDHTCKEDINALVDCVKAMRAEV